MRVSRRSAPQAPLWRVFYTRSRAEKACERELKRKGIEVLVPKCIVERQWSDRTKKVVEPLFRNYLFAQVDERDRLRVLETNGIVRSLMFDGRLVALDTSEVERLQKAQQQPARLAFIAYPELQVGEVAVVVEGPLAGLRGEVVAYRGQQKMIVRVESIRQAFSVLVPNDWVRPAKNTQPSYQILGE